MTLKIGTAIGRGTKRSLSVSGIVLLVAMALYQVALVGSMNTIVLNSLPADAPPEATTQIGVGFPISTAVAAALGVVAFLFGVGIFIAATRLFSRDLSELGSVPMGVIGRRFGWAFLSTLAVSLILGIIIPIGFVFLLVPGIFFAVSFQFAVFAVGVEDHGPISALRRSWELATGNRWRLFGVLLIVAVLGGIGGAIGSLVSIASPTAGQLVSLGFNSVFTVVTYGILADAFVQLRGESGSGAASSATAAL